METRHGPGCEVTERFIKSADKVSELQDEGTTKEFNLWQTAVQNDRTHFYPHLSAIVQCFSANRLLQTAWEASPSPTIHLSYPLLEKIEVLIKDNVVWCYGYR